MPSSGGKNLSSRHILDPLSSLKRFKVLLRRHIQELLTSFLHYLNTTFFWFFLILLRLTFARDFHAEHVVGLLPIKSTEDVKPVIHILLSQYYALVEGASCWLKLVNSDLSCPSLRFEAEFIHIVESLLALVYTPKNVHGCSSCAGAVSIPALYISIYFDWF